MRFNECERYFCWQCSFSITLSTKRGNDEKTKKEVWGKTCKVGVRESSRLFLKSIIFAPTKLMNNLHNNVSNERSVTHSCATWNTYTYSLSRIFHYIHILVLHFENINGQNGQKKAKRTRKKNPTNEKEEKEFEWIHLFEDKSNSWICLSFILQPVTSAFSF